MSESTGRLCALTPVAAGRVDALDEELARLAPPATSPFARLERVHCARWTVVRLAGRDGQALPELPPYLLFAAEFDGSVRALVEDVCSAMPIEAAAVWGCCARFPGVAVPALEAYLVQHAIRPGYSVVAFPGVSVRQVRTALDLRARLEAFAVGWQGASPAELRRAWSEAFE